MEINNILTQITNGPYKSEFYQIFGRKSKLYLHKNFDPRNNYFYYVRQSKQSDDITSKEWQLTNLSGNGLNNIIVSNNSAYKENKANYIFDIIKYIVQSGNKNFTLSVSDYSRFSRNLKTTELIYNYLFDNEVQFYLNVDGKIYNYIEDYYKPQDNLRKYFINCQNFSFELTREMIKVHKNKKEKRFKINYTQLATNYFKWFISHQDFLNKDILKDIFTSQKLNEYYIETDNMFQKENNFYYFYCNNTNLMIICPREIACIEGIDSSFIEGFSQDLLLNIANCEDESINYICYFRDNFDMSNMNNELN